LFSLYKAELTLRIRNQKNLIRYNQVLDQFQDFLSDNAPSSVLAKGFLSKWSKQKPATLYKYTSIIKGFLSWYGEELDLKVKLSHQLPEYVEDESVQELIAAIKKKQTHKKAIDRDILLIELAYNSGLRREELANLKVSDILINEKAVIVRKGKGGKDRTVPLPSRIVKLLETHITDMNSDERVFNVRPVAIGDKISRIAKNAGVQIHAHSLRHGYATRLLEKGANIKAVQELLGHSRIGTTEVYLSLLPRHLREAVDLLEEPGPDISGTGNGRESGLGLPIDHSVFNNVPATGVRSLDQHWADLSEVARKLVNNLRLFRRYELWSGEMLSEIVLPEEDAKKLETADTFLGRCLFDHVRSETQQLAHVQNWGQLRLGEITEELLAVLSAIAWGRVPKGTCAVCG
jgi:integrase/recombinase XerD